jgi:mono/diheme cytochrome c family protein
MTARQRTLLTVVFAVFGVLILEAFVGLIVVFSGLYNVAASRPHSKLAYWLLGATMERSVEHHAGGVRPPGQASVVEGASHFAQMCVLCHGGPGVERSEIGQGLNPLAPDLSEEGAEWSLEEVYWVVKHGIKMTGMPAFVATHSEEQLWAMAYFVKQLPQLAPEQYQELAAKAGQEGQAEGVSPPKGPEQPH